MIQPSGGGFLDGLHSWLHGLPVVCDLVTCHSTGDDSREPRSRGMRPARSFVEARAEPTPLWPSTSSYRGCGNDENRDGAWKSDESEVARRTRALEEDLASDLNRLAEERRRGLHRLDSELAEAVETLHAETARKANERIERHRQILADLEAERCITSQNPVLQAFGRQPAPEEDDGSDASEEELDEEGAGASHLGVLGRLVNFIHGSEGGLDDRDEPGLESRSRSRDSDLEELDEDDYDACAPRLQLRRTTEDHFSNGSMRRPNSATPSACEPQLALRSPSIDARPFHQAGSVGGYQQQRPPRQ